MNGYKIIEETFVVTNPMGLDLSCAKMLVQTGFQFKADVAVKYRAEMVDGKSLLSVLALGVSCGAEVEVSVYGCDASQAMQAIEHLFNHAFCAGEEPVPQECTVAT